jgi:hypothetical protein
MISLSSNGTQPKLPTFPNSKEKELESLKAKRAKQGNRETDG